MKTIPKKNSRSNEKIVAAVIQMVSGSDLEKNLKSAEDLITEAVSEGATLVLLPEVFAVLESGEIGRKKNAVMR
jgi:predicted amidohydrolase